MGTEQKIANGQHTVYEVWQNDLTNLCPSDFSTYFGAHTYVATFWNEDLAHAFNAIINGDNDKDNVTRFNAVVTEGQIFIDNSTSVPVETVAESISQAAEIVAVRLANTPTFYMAEGHTHGPALVNNANVPCDQFPGFDRLMALASL